MCALDSVLSCVWWQAGGSHAFFGEIDQLRIWEGGPISVVSM